MVGGRGVLGGGGYRCWTLWKPERRGTGTKMTIAFLPWPTSSCGAEGGCVSLCPCQFTSLLRFEERCRCIAPIACEGLALERHCGVGWRSCGEKGLLHEQRRTAEASARSSCPGYLTPSRRGRLRYCSRARKAFASKGSWVRSC